MICADVARYALGSTGEPTQGAGSVAMIVSERPRLHELDVGRSGVYARDVHDFWRPLHSKDAAVDGRLSVQCYLDALAGAYSEWRRSGSAASAEEPLAPTSKASMRGSSEMIIATAPAPWVGSPGESRW